MKENELTTDVDEYLKYREDIKYNRELQIKYSRRLLDMINTVEGNPELRLCGKIAALSVIEPKTDVCSLIRHEAIKAMRVRK